MKYFQWNAETNGGGEMTFEEATASKVSMLASPPNRTQSGMVANMYMIHHSCFFSLTPAYTGNRFEYAADLEHSFCILEGFIVSLDCCTVVGAKQSTLGT
jgi:hypothetical protein